jgi:hypothetical protein
MMLPSDRLGAAAVAASLVGGVAGAVLDLPIVAFNGYVSRRATPSEAFAP